MFQVGSAGLVGAQLPPIALTRKTVAWGYSFVPIAGESRFIPVA